MCRIEHKAQIFPLTFLDKIELNELNGIDLPSQLSSLSPYEVRSKLMKLPILNDFDMDENQGGSRNGRRTLKIFWEGWYAREVSRFVRNKVRLF